MAWKGNSTSKQQNGIGINPVPNVKQENSNLSDIRSSTLRSGDTGLPIDDKINYKGNENIPLVGGYKKEYATRRDLDNTKDISISLIQIDETIINHLTKRVGLSVMDNGSLVDVPVLYANPERWEAIRVDGFLRDNQGKILLPAMVIKRTNVSNNKDLMTLNRYLTCQVVTKFDEKNKYDQFNILNSSKPTKQIYNVTLPDHVILTYECIIWTDYVDQNNILLEKINFATHDYWGIDKFRFRTRIDDYTNTVEVGDGEDRNVRTTFNLIVNAYLLPDTIDKVKSTTNKTFTIRKIMTSDRVVSASEMGIVKKNATLKNPYAYLKGVGVEYNQEQNRPLSEEIIPVVEKTQFHPAPSSTTDYGENGWLAYDANYFYVYRTNMGWLRKPMATFDFDPITGQYISGYDCDDNPIYSTGVRPINTAFRVFQRFHDKLYHQVPYLSSDYGEDGWLSFDGNYFYIYSMEEWRRVPITLVNETF